MDKGQTYASDKSTQRLAQCAWNDIQSPGAYLVVGSGDLVRINADALQLGHSPLITVTSKGGTTVAKLSDNPAEPISVLRQIAADSDFGVNF